MCHHVNISGPHEYFINDENQSQYLSLFKEHPYLTHRKILEIIGVCYGLVCILYEDESGLWKFAIHNPTTKQIVRTNYPLE